MALLVREPLCSRARLRALPPGGGSVRGLLRDCARELVSGGGTALWPRGRPSPARRPASLAAVFPKGGPRLGVPVLARSRDELLFGSF